MWYSLHYSWSDTKLDTICQSDEFSQYHLKAGEKVFYNTVVNQNPAIRFPFKAATKAGPAVQDTWQKVSLLIQVLLLQYPTDNQVRTGTSRFLHGRKAHQKQIPLQMYVPRPFPDPLPRHPLNEMHARMRAFTKRCRKSGLSHAS